LSEIDDIRLTLSGLPEDQSSLMIEPPEPTEIYAPPDHQAALDPNRAIVVGARGMGKSFWAGAYTSEKARASISFLYPQLKLDRVTVAQGFTGSEGGDAPSRRLLKEHLTAGASSDDIWRAVLSRIISRKLGNDGRNQGDDWASWIALAQNSSEVEPLFRSASQHWLDDQTRLVVVFDGLDRLGDDWPTIRTLTLGLLRTALDFRSYRGIRLKIFMRQDQFDDDYVFAFPDASKLRAEAVRLEWKTNDLYGLLFTTLARSLPASSTFNRFLERSGVHIETIHDLPTLPLRLRESVVLQEAIFTRVAGKYMGADHRRGKTYTWLTNHLMDAKGEVSPRSFLRALREAARHRPAPSRTAIEPAGIRDGIKAASQVRLNQLVEDHPWARAALQVLADQQVPCDEDDFLRKWQARGTAQAMVKASSSRDRAPVEIIEAQGKPEVALLEAFIRLGVVERRDDSRINMPDVYRVAARLLRKGGVPVRRARS
jgi:hypothetical protein